MAAGGYRVELKNLRGGGLRLGDLADEVRDGIGEPLSPPAGSNQGFTSIQAAVVAAEAWETEIGELARALQGAGDKLAETAAEYDRADACGAHVFQRILRRG